MSRSHRPIFARLILALTLLGLVLAPAMVMASAARMQEQSAVQPDGCCKAKAQPSNTSLPASHDDDGCCKGGCFGCCLATFTAGYVLDRSTNPSAGASPAPRLSMTGAQASAPSSAFLDSIFHPPRA